MIYLLRGSHRSGLLNSYANLEIGDLEIQASNFARDAFDANMVGPKDAGLHAA